jgi:hypothetical protein
VHSVDSQAPIESHTVPVVRAIRARHYSPENDATHMSCNALPAEVKVLGISIRARNAITSE